MSALSFSKRVERSVRCPVVQVLQAAGVVTGKSIDGDFHQDFFCWLSGGWEGDPATVYT